jgi:ATP phosphoribosyltransferase regulatory subunit
VLNIDFSVVDDMHYYNGFVCKGFVQGLPDSVLSGGQYDKLMKKMHRQSGAMGFAVYLDQLEYLAQPQDDYDVDVVILYNALSAATAADKAAALRAEGQRVLVQKQLPGDLRYCQLMDLR